MRVNALSSSLLWLAGAHALALPAVVERQADAPVATEDIIPTDRTVKVSISVAPTGTVNILPTLSDVEPHTTGTVVTEVETLSKNILMTDPIPSPTSLLQPLKLTLTKARRDPEATPDADALEKRQAAAPASDIFSVPVGTKYPNTTTIPRRDDHPIPRTGITKSGPIQTNKFFSNFFLGDQAAPVSTFPYSVSWAKGSTSSVSYGLAISHIDSNQRVFGPVEYNKANAFFINPAGIHSIILSAKELGKDTVLYTDQISPFFVRANLKVNAAATKPVVQFPISQGMGFVTGIYAGGVPILQTGVFFRTLTKVTTNPKTNVVKYTIVLEDGKTWRVYGYHTSGSALDLKVTNNGLITSTRAFTGIIQIAKDPKTGISERVLDYAAGIYNSGTTVVGSVSGTAGASGSYSLKFARAGHATGNLFMFALPHHVATFDTETKSRVKDYKLQTTTKGVATAFVGTWMTMLEPSLPVGMDLAPWDPTRGPRKTLSAAAKAAIAKVAHVEVSENMDYEINKSNSMYFSGKAFLKYAQIIYVINDLVGDKALAQAGLANLKAIFARFAANQQQTPLIYDRAWGGLISSASNVDGDFGNPMYNDHHFHYGYHVLAAAYIGYLDKAWAVENAEYVNTLVREYANPSTRDVYYAQHRTFDWYHGHSWAAGLHRSMDGKDQESSSEDVMATYALKMWGAVIGDVNMVARANLQLAVMTRSMQNYYLYTSDNKHQPASFIGNKVAGILWENKIHHTVHFDDPHPLAAIQGIHMLPIHAPSALQRTKTFVQQEWDAFFGAGKVDAFDSGWKGIAYANYAIVNPKASWDFFNSTTFSSNWLDGGASRSWYMAYSAALGGL